MSDFGYGGPPGPGGGGGGNGYGDGYGGTPGAPTAPTEPLGGYGGQGGGGAGPGGYGGGGYGGPPPPSAAEAIGVGSLLGDAVRAVTSNFATFVVAALVFTLPGQILTAIGSHQLQKSFSELVPLLQSGGNPGLFFEQLELGGLVFLVAGLLVSLACYFLCQGTLTYASVESVAGNRVSPGDALAKGFRAAPSVIVIAIVLTMFYILAALPGVVSYVLVMVGMAGMGGGDPAGPLVAICCGCPLSFGLILVPVYWIFLLFLLSIPAAVAEKVGPIQAMQRSLTLSKGHRLKLLGGTLVLFLVSIVFAVITALAMVPLSGGVDPSTGMPQAPSALATVVSTVLSTAQSILQLTLFSSFAGVAYARIRGADEGVDAASIASVFS